MSARQRVAVTLLTMSAAGFAAWQAHEGFTDVAVIPTKGDVPTIGHGSTRWEDGTRVRMGDTITRQRAEVLARNLNSQAEREFAASLPGVKLHQEEFDLYMDFVGQYGIGTWRASSMRRDLLASNYPQACHDLLKYRFAAGFDCSTPGNRRCAGVWARQLERHAKCIEAQR
ncbi:glycoside hydrolase family protein [Pseudomonas sp. GD03860]|uniref:glycoside hydrolase family protein n=1 Tax=Pseudomonas sp. GD03860 TaxID=2975389 RepID=UPI0024493CDC|nr:glycoside hydrolase family protein [Pseudomonas sp. GD03860]MDH0639083.1 glycoside hydrolase family protein [Pseudomonas sp. GD03860]